MPKDKESNLGDHRVRKYDSEVGRFLAVDPLWEKYHTLNPFQYSANSPVMKVDINGMNEEQRLEAIKLAEEYIGSGSTYVMGKKGLPGDPVDCSGLISNCVTAGDEPDPNKGSQTSGILNIEKNKKLSEIELKDVQSGNIITFRGLSTYPYHGGIIKSVNRDESGNVISLTVVHASSSANKTVEKNIDIKNNDFWAKHINGFYKWDSIPD
ncbi:MAG: hypothetical protein NTW25_01870 [Candidatus Kapabacteria bacterium]|nr:hypothetical protein [Candidatus Kapabacteria bacterium]